VEACARRIDGHVVDRRCAGLGDDPEIRANTLKNSRLRARFLASDSQQTPSIRASFCVIFCKIGGGFYVNDFAKLNFIAANPFFLRLPAAMISLALPKLKNLGEEARRKLSRKGKSVTLGISRDKSEGAGIPFRPIKLKRIFSTLLTTSS
jgi:hypothetical protein